MTIDPKLVELLQLASGPLGQRKKEDRAWLNRFMKEAVEPFDQILKEQATDWVEQCKKRGLNRETIAESHDFHDDTNCVLALMLTLVVVSNFPPNDQMALAAIELLNMKIGTDAKELYKEARATMPNRGKV
jgi:hypothetical protein